MAMTEKEVEKLTTEVGEVDWTDPFYADWLRTNLVSAETDEKRLRAAWRFHKLMRDDERMQVALQELRRTRQTIETLKNLLEASNE